MRETKRGIKRLINANRVRCFTLKLLIDASGFFVKWKIDSIDIENRLNVMWMELKGSLLPSSIQSFNTTFFILHLIVMIIILCRNKIESLHKSCVFDQV